MSKNHSLLLEINFPNKHPAQKVAIKILTHYFLVKIITFSSRSIFLFKFVGHGFPMKAFLIDIVTLRSFPQRLEQFVLTASPTPPHTKRTNK